jgi:hypothetical protein
MLFYKSVLTSSGISLTKSDILLLKKIEALKLSVVGSM